MRLLTSLLEDRVGSMVAVRSSLLTCLVLSAVWGWGFGPDLGSDIDWLVQKEKAFDRFLDEDGV